MYSVYCKINNDVDVVLCLRFRRSPATKRQFSLQILYSYLCRKIVDKFTLHMLWRLMEEQICMGVCCNTATAVVAAAAAAAAAKMLHACCTVIYYTQVFIYINMNTCAL
ncbi:unnamed protein product [Ceratitis capitata]|uniref:(Mediterranean fruit fly) hypothetical protein n=1 Tax=Ceratitis capitata TaxID=7213 RepID=A0A811UNG5_CERCA|nr:unnamed protein product [Ceratitis capitata]